MEGGNLQYGHIKCKCGGDIGIYDGILRCNRCFKTYAIWKIKYDHFESDPTTGWVFPMQVKKSNTVIF